MNLIADVVYQEFCSLGNITSGYNRYARSYIRKRNISFNLNNYKQEIQHEDYIPTIELETDVGLTRMIKKRGESIQSIQELM